METAGADGDVTYMYAVVTAVAHILSFKNMNTPSFCSEICLAIFGLYLSLKALKLTLTANQLACLQRNAGTH